MAEDQLVIFFLMGGAGHTAAEIGGGQSRLRRLQSERFSGRCSGCRNRKSFTSAESEASRLDFLEELWSVEGSIFTRAAGCAARPAGCAESAG